MAHPDRNGEVDGTIRGSRSTRIVQVEIAKPNLTTHSMHCSKCKSEITKVVHRRKLEATNAIRDPVGCPSCLSLFSCPVSLSDGIELISFNPPTQKPDDPLDWFEAEYLRSLRVVDPNIAGEKYVPDWLIANNDSVLAPDLAKHFVYKLGTSSDYLLFRNMGHSDLSNLAMVNQAQSNLLTSELHRRWLEAEVENKKLRRQLKHTGSSPRPLHELEELKKRLADAFTEAIANQNAAAILAETNAALDGIIVTIETQQKELERRIDDLSESYETQTKMYAELEADYARLQAAEKEWERKVAHLNIAKRDIQEKHIRDVEEHTKQVAHLNNAIATLEQQKRWLLTSGVQHLSHKIRTSHEMITAVAAVNNATNLCGFVDGIRAGYHYALEAKIAMESVPDLPQNVEEKLNLATSEFDNLSIQLVATLAAHVESPFEEIKQLLQAP